MKKLIIILMLLVCCSVTYAWYDGIYYTYDDTFNNTGLTTSGAYTQAGDYEGFVAGKVGNGLDLEFSDNDYVQNITVSGTDIDKIRTVDFWFNLEADHDYPVAFAIYGANGNDRLIFFEDGGQFYAYHAVDGTQANTNGGSIASDGTWYHVIYMMGEGGINFTIDTVSVATSASTIHPDTDFYKIITGWDTGNEKWDGVVDNVFLSFTRYTTQNITDSHNSGNGMNFSSVEAGAGDATAPTITDIATNATDETLSGASINLSATCTDGGGAAKIWYEKYNGTMYVNATEAGVNTSDDYTSGTTYEFNITVTEVRGTEMEYLIYCNDTSGNIGKSESQNFTVSGGTINISWISPTADGDHQRLSVQEYKLNVTCVNEICEGVNVTLDPTESTKGATWEIIDNPDGTKNMLLYSGLRYIYEDNKWKDIKDAKSLKNYYNIKYLTKDSKYDITIIDFNYTDIEFEIFANESGNIPLEVFEYETIIEDDKIKKIKKEKFKDDYDFSDKKTKKIKYNIDDNVLKYHYKLGKASTEIVLENNETENLADANVYSAEADYSQGKCTYMFLKSASAGAQIGRNYMMFDLTQLPPESVIYNATLSMYSSGAQTDTAELHHVMVYNWSDWNATTTSCSQNYGAGGANNYEQVITWNNQMCGTNFDVSELCNLTSMNTSAWGPTNAWVDHYATPAVKKSFKEGKDNVSFVLKPTTETSGTGSHNYYSREYSADETLRPYLNITYSEKGIINNTIGATPFYHNGSDIEYSCGLMNAGDICEASFWVNATGTKDIAYSFYAIVEANESYVNIPTANTEILLRTITNAPPTAPTDIIWSTTGGFTDDTLIYNQIIDYINTTCVTDVEGELSSCAVTVRDPDNNTVIDDQTMTNSTDYWEYTTDFDLNKAGTWEIIVTAEDGYDEINSTTTFKVSIQNLSTTEGWFGYTDGYISTTSDIAGLTNYGFDLIEISENVTQMGYNWTAILTAINESYAHNVHIGFNIMLNINYTNQTEIDYVLRNISSHYSDLTNDPYGSTIEYLSFEIINSSAFIDANISSVLNDAAENATKATGNNFVIYSKNYNSSNLDTGYITYTEMRYIDPTSTSNWIVEEKNFLRNSTTTNRIYVTLSDEMKTNVQNFQEDILDLLRGTPVITDVTNENVSELSNGDILVLNDADELVSMPVDVSAIASIINKDAWDATNNLLIEKDTDGIFNVNISSTSATLVFFEDLDHIQISGNDNILYKATSDGKLSFNYTDNTQDGSWTISGDNDILFEGFDPNYKVNNFITYYGWFNASYVHNWSNYDYVIFDDENADELSNLLENTTTTEFYGYISVADYANTERWLEIKRSEVDNITLLNDSTRIHIFVDGLDYSVGGTNFSNKMKSLVDYIKVTKERDVGLNTYTAYEQFCTWSAPDGFCMKESCIGRWNGSDSGSPDAYTFEDWDLEVNKSRWYNSHNVEILCQAFHNRTSDTFQPLNWTVVQDMYFASLVLGYDYFHISQPDFNYAHTIYTYDAGTDLANDCSTDDEETYYRAYSNGIVYYNSSSNKGWIEDGRVINQVQVCMNLIDAGDGAGNEDDNLTFVVNNGTKTYNFSSSDVVWSAGGNWYCLNLTEEDYSYTGNYDIYASMENRGDAGDGVALTFDYYANTGKHSWWDNSAGGSPYTWNVYGMNQNWMVNVKVNETKKTSIDSFDNITQTETVDSTNKITNITINSSDAYDIEIWSDVIDLDAASLVNVTYNNGSGWSLIYPQNSDDCDSNNPTFNSTTIDSESHKACYVEKGGTTYLRLAPPSLSERVYSATGSVVPSPPSTSAAGTPQDDHKVPIETVAEKKTGAPIKIENTYVLFALVILAAFAVYQISKGTTPYKTLIAIVVLLVITQSQGIGLGIDFTKENILNLLNNIGGRISKNNPVLGVSIIAIAGWLVFNYFRRR